MSEVRARTEAVALAYFEAVGERDSVAVAELFADQGELVTGYSVIRGAANIETFYQTTAFAVPDLETVPESLIVGEDAAAAEVALKMGGNLTLNPHFFFMADGKIERLIVYTGSPLPPR